MAAKRGRPMQKAKLVDKLPGDEAIKAKLKVVMETVSGERSLESACAYLSLSKSAFCELRDKMLAGALAAMQPQAPGRKPAAKEPAEVTELKKKVEDLEVQLEAAEIREQLALVFPHLVERNQKKTGGPDRKTDK